MPVAAVRYQGIIHDFVMLDALRETRAAQSAIDLATLTLRQTLGTDWAGAAGCWSADALQWPAVPQ